MMMRTALILHAPESITPNPVTGDKAERTDMSTRTTCTSRRAILLVCIVASTANALGGDEDIRFTQLTIDENPPSRPYYKMVGDINGDGFVDIVVGGAKGPLVAYLYPNWEKWRIAEDGWDGVKGELADIDADGYLDVVMGGIIWFANPGVDDGPWQVHRIDHQKAHDVAVADLDLDGRLDVVARDQSAFRGNGAEILIYFQGESGSWRKQTIECPHGEGLKPGDLDRDGDNDIVIGGKWYENPRRVAARWTERPYTSKWREPDAKVEMADVNGDGRADIILTPAELQGEKYRVCWYQAPASPTSAAWTEHVVVESIECVIHSLGVGDFDGDGDKDIAMAEMHQGEDPDEVVVMINLAQGNTWRKQVLSDRGSRDIVVADFGRDGDLDIVGANHAGVHPLELWRNDR